MAYIEQLLQKLEAILGEEGEQVEGRGPVVLALVIQVSLNTLHQLADILHDWLDIPVLAVGET